MSSNGTAFIEFPWIRRCDDGFLIMEVPVHISHGVEAWEMIGKVKFGHGFHHRLEVNIVCQERRREVTAHIGRSSRKANFLTLRALVALLLHGVHEAILLVEVLACIE
jgi:hypothetical protein